jgi:hypothetical protein
LVWLAKTALNCNIETDKRGTHLLFLPVQLYVDQKVDYNSTNNTTLLHSTVSNPKPLEN